MDTTTSPTSPTDRNFDDLVERFGQKIYQGAKGQIRLAILQEDLLAQMPELTTGRPLRILDAGAGTGHMAMWLAGMGHEVVLCDLSSAMLAQAQSNFREQGLSRERVHFIHSPIQELQGQLQGPFDLILFHAVLEWLERPHATLLQLIPWLMPQGRLSLMFYNIHSMVYRNLLRGNFRKVESGSFAGETGGLTPQNPLEPAEVRQWCERAGLQLECSSGIRVIHDYMSRELQQTRSMEDLIRLESRYGRIEPYRSLGRYMHYLLSKT